MKARAVPVKLRLWSGLEATEQAGTASQVTNN